MKKLGLGTAAIGRPLYINIREVESASFDKALFIQKGKEVLDAAYQNGVRYFDTAPGYGLAEQLLIDWVKTQNDVTIEVATKWGYTYVADFKPDAKVHEIKEHSLDKLNEQWEVSKQLLPYLTTLQIHSATFDTGVLENEAVLNRLAEIKNDFGVRIGLTTTGVNQVDVLQKALTIYKDDQLLFDVFQVTYNVFDQSLWQIKDKIHTVGARIIIKEALANGRVFRNAAYPHYHSLYDAMEQLAHKYQVGIDAVALQFCFSSIQPYAVLSGASVVDHLKSNLRTSDFTLTSLELHQLHTLKADSIQYWNERKLLIWN